MASSAYMRAFLRVTSSLVHVPGVGLLVYTTAVFLVMCCDFPHVLFYSSANAYNTVVWGVF